MTKEDLKSEHQRVKALHAYEILDTPEEKEFDNLVKLAAQICEVPFAKLNFLDGDRSWSKANYGNDIKETPQEAAFCHYTIQDETHMVIEDTLKDDRFRSSSFVIKSPNVRFYAGVNIKGKGQNIGTICVLGQEPKQLTDAQLESLNIIASEVESRLELKNKNKDLATLTAFLEASVEAMLIVNPGSQKIEHKNSNGNELLSRLIGTNDEQPIYELFPGWDYLDELKKWYESGIQEPLKMETSLLDNEGEEVFLEVNTTQKYGKWLITFQNITKRKFAEQALKKEKKLSDTIINALPSHFYMFDEEMNFIRWNKNVCDTTGRSDEELVDLSPVDFFEGDDIQRISEYVEKTMNGFKGSIQVELVMKDGTKEPYLYHAIAFEDSGKKYFLGTGQSVAEQVEYQTKLENLITQKEVLLQEVHHRVKNNLAVISGFLQLQELISEEEETKSVLLSNYMRVKSMALIHEELYKANDFTGIDFEHYLKRMLIVLEEKFSQPEKNIKLNICSESIFMNLNQAVPLALIVNELVSNAYSFAFSGKENGNVWVRFKKRGDQIYLSVEDDGIGLPDDFKLKESPTLGTTLVSSYSEQIDAEVKISSENGTHYEFRFRNNTEHKGSNFHLAI